MIDASAVASALLMGLAGSGHCALMCGGLVGLASSTRIGSQRFSTRVALGRAAASSAGRVLSYGMAGAVAGAAGAGLVSDRLPWVLRLLAGIMMIGVGLQLAGIARMHRPMEWLGQVLWRRISGTALRFAVARSLSGAFLFGLVWGWLPCGLVYAALALAGTTGSAAGGALAMTAFGAGTVPVLAGLGWTGEFVARYARRREVRWVAGAAMLLLGTVQMTSAWRSMRSVSTAPPCHQVGVFRPIPSRSRSRASSPTGSRLLATRLRPRSVSAEIHRPSLLDCRRRGNSTDYVV